MYLNLDLLYNVEIYFFPLFYYKHGFNNKIMESFKKEYYSIIETEYIFFNIKYSKCNLIKLKKEELE